MGYRGTVVSDWHGITDRPASLRAGGDLDMPQSRQRATRLAAAVAAGEASDAEPDRAATRVLTLVDRATAEARPTRPFDADDHHTLARHITREGSVLLANDVILPLSPGSAADLLLLGEGATEPVIQGFGSARMTPTRVDIPLDAIAERAGGDVRHLIGVAHEPGERAQALEDAVAAASVAPVVVVFAHTNQNTGSEMEMPWLDQVNAVLVPFYAGQGMGIAAHGRTLALEQAHHHVPPTSAGPAVVLRLPTSNVVSVKVETSSISLATFCSIGIATGSPRLARPPEMRERQRSSTHSRRSG